MSTTELDELGEDTEDLAEGFSKYRDELMALTGFDIMEDVDAGEFKDLFEIFGGISEGWEKLSDTQQARVSEILGGTRQLQVISSILNNWDDAIGAYDDAMNSAGTATEANDTYMESMEAHLNVLSASMQELWTDTFSADFLNGWIDLGNTIINIVDDVGMLQTALLAVVGVMSARGNGLFDFSTETGFSKLFTDFQQEISASVKKAQESTVAKGGQGFLRTLLFGSGETVDISQSLGLDEAEKAISDLGTRLAGGTEGFNLNAWADNMQKTGKMSSYCAEAMKEAGKSMDVTKMSAKDLVDTNTKLVASEQKLNSSMSTTGLVGTLKNVGTQLLTVAANVAIAMAAMAAISAIVNLASTAWDDYVHASEKAIEAGEEAMSAISDINSEYQNEASTIKDVSDRYEELASGVDMTTNKNISLTSSEYDEYLSICNQIADIYPSLVSGYTEQGDAILNLGNNAETAAQQLQEMLDVDQAIAARDIAEYINDAYVGTAEQVKLLTEEKEALEAAAEAQDDIISGMQEALYGVTGNEGLGQQLAALISGEAGYLQLDTMADDYIETYQELAGIFEAAGVSMSDVTNQVDDGIQTLSFEGQDLQKILSYLGMTTDETGKSLESLISDMSLERNQNIFDAALKEAEIEQQWNELFEQAIIPSLSANINYTSLTDEIQNGIADAVKNCDLTQIPEEYLTDDETLDNFFYDNYVKPIAYAFSEANENEDIQKAFNRLFKLDTSVLSVDQYQDAVGNYLDSIHDWYLETFPDNGEEIYQEFIINYGFKVNIVDDDGSVIGTADSVDGLITDISDLAALNGEDISQLENNLRTLTVDQLISIHTHVTADNFGGSVSDYVDEEIERINKETKEKSVSLYDILSSEDEDNFSDRIDTFQSDIKDISSALDDLRNGEEVSLTDLVQDFPELVNSLDDLEGGLTSLSLQRLDEFSSEWKDTFSGASTEELEKANKLFNEMVSDVDISTYVDQYKEAFADYEDIAAEVAESSVDTAETVFGNIDTNNRQILEWTEQNLSEYQNAIESWGMSVKDLAGSYSTVLSMEGEYGGVDITFSPMLQTENGAVLLTKDAVNDYLTQLVDSLPEGWGEEELLAADARGISGSYISGLVAGITEGADEAERLGEAMHLVGDTGAYQDAANGLKKITDQLRNTAFNNVVENLGRDQLGLETEAYNNLVQLFDMYAGDEAALEAIVKISANPDAANWTIDEWIAQLEDEEIYIQLRVSAENLDDLQDELSALEDEQKLLESSQSLSEALGIKKTTQDYKKLINNSKKQVKNIQDQNKELETQKKIYEDLGRDTQDIESQISDNLASINSAFEDQLEWHELTLTLNYDQAVEGVEAFRTALSESTSDTLLAQDTIKSLMDTFSDLDSYDPSALFYKTSAGVDVNTTSLKGLEQEYVNLKKQDYVDQLASYGREYTQAKSYVDALGKSYDQLSKEEKEAMSAAGYRGLDEIEQDITEVDLLISELDGLTSAYETWVEAASSGNQRDAFESMGDYYSTAEDLINRGWYNNEGLNAYLDLMLSAEQRSGNAIDDFNKLTETIEGTDHSLVDYFQYNENGDLVNDGIYAFVDDVISTMGEGYARIDEETGNYEFGMWSEQDVQDIADRFGTTADYIWKLVDAAQEAGFELYTTEDYIQDALDAMGNVDVSTLEGLQTEGKLTEKIALDFDVTEMSTDEIDDKLSELDEVEHELFVDMDMGAIDWDTYIQALSELEALRDSLNSQGIRLQVETEMEEGNLQELDQIINAGEYEEEIALRFGIDMEEEGWEDEVHAIAEVIQDEAQGERIQMTVESTLEEKGMTIEELADEVNALESTDEINTYFGIEADTEEAEALVEYVNELEEANKTWDLTIRVEDEQFNQLLDAINGEEATVDVTADTGEAESEVNSFVSETDGTEATLEYTTTASDSDVSTIVSEIEALEPTVHVNADVSEAKSEITGLVDLLPEEGTTVTVTAKAEGLEELQSLSGAIDEVLDKTVNVVAEVSGESEVRSLTSAINALTGKIVSVSAQVSGRGEVDALRSSIAAVNSKTVTITSVTQEVTKLLGSAHVSGTTVNNTWNDYRHSIGAYAGGTWHDWSIPQDELALTNEIGQESIVRDGKWMLLPGGAHVQQLKRGDIVIKRAFAW